MKKFLIERNLPGAGNLSPQELQYLAQTFCDVSGTMVPAYQWIQSLVTDDKIYCIHIAESEKAVREHARRGGFPINIVAEVKAIMDPITSKGN